MEPKKAGFLMSFIPIISIIAWVYSFNNMWDSQPVITIVLSIVLLIVSPILIVFGLGMLFEKDKKDK
jgi:biotin transporter BioY